MEVPYLEK